MTHTFVSLAARAEAAGGQAALPIRAVQAQSTFGRWMLDIWGGEHSDSKTAGPAYLTSAQGEALARCLQIAEPKTIHRADGSGVVSGFTPDDIYVTIFILDEEASSPDGGDA